MSSYLRPRRGKKSTAETQLTSSTPLKRGEVFFEVPDTGVGTGNGKIKMGDGVTGYSALPYFLDDSGNGGHTIQNESGTDLTQRNTLQFADSHVSDDSTNSKTVIENVKEVTLAELEQETDRGFYLATDEESAPIGEIGVDYEEVEADGTKTLGTLLNELYSEIDLSKITEHAVLFRGDDAYYMQLSRITSDNHLLFGSVVGQSSALLNYEVDMFTSGSRIQYAKVQSSGNTITSITSNQPANHTKLRFYYGTSSGIVELNTDARHCMMSNGVTSVEDALDEAIGLASNKAVYNGLFPTFSLSGIQETKVIDQDITLTEEHVILITFSTYVAKANNGSFYTPLKIDGIDHGNILLLSQTLSTFVSSSYAIKLSAGVHNIKLFVATDNASATASNESFRRGMYTIAVL